MSEAKKNIDACIGHLLGRNLDPRDICRKLFLYDVPDVFETHPNEGFQLFHEISIHFSVPFSSIKATGSAQLGYSYYNQREFQADVSDLDVAIISSSLFERYSELCYVLTDRYTNQTGFTGVNGRTPNEQVDAFLGYLARGYFRPDFMPNCHMKSSWREFFGKLTTRYHRWFPFAKITAGIYMTEEFFAFKQATLISAYKQAKP